MASRHLALVEDKALADARSLRSGLIDLRTMIESKVGEHAGIDLSLSKDMSAINVTILLKTDRSGDEACFLLKHAEFPDVAFRDVEVRPVPTKAHRKMIVARVVHPSD